MNGQELRDKLYNLLTDYDEEVYDMEGLVIELMALYVDLLAEKQERGLIAPSTEKELEFLLGVVINGKVHRIPDRVVERQLVKEGELTPWTKLKVVRIKTKKKGGNE